ncbi:SDR family oxidoreductase [Pseudomonadales bacterium]|nr:SDR family oxidoreductase [Pseudomonadales bacterium]
MRLGITGGKGFIGSAFKKYMSGKGHDIVDYHCNLSDSTEVEHMFLSLGAPTVLVHLAGRFSGSTEVVYQDNLVSTHNLLSALSKYPKVHLVFGSTGAVYGNSGGLPISEATLCKPNTTYGLVKLFCEEAISYHERYSDLESTVLRFPSVYGSNNSKGIIYNWVQGALTKKNIVIHGDGLQQRSFINVIDICDALFEIIDKRITGTYNVSHSEIFDLNALSKLFEDVFSVDTSYEKTNNALESMVLDSSRLKAASSWNPKCELKKFLQSYSNSPL